MVPAIRRPWGLGEFRIHLAGHLLLSIIMKIRHTLAVFVVLGLMTPIVLTIGMFVVIPIALTLLPVLLVLGVMAVPALLLVADGSAPDATGRGWSARPGARVIAHAA